MYTRLTQIALTMLAAFALTFSARAHAAAFVDTEYTKTEIIAETNGFAPGETVWFAVRQQVRENWHVFWVNPGDAGIPLSLKWTLPEGYSTGDILHAAPEFIPVGPLASYAHEGVPVFLVSVTAPPSAAPGDVVNVVIDATWQTCEEICVPEDGRFEFEMPVVASLELRSENVALFDAARRALPPLHQGAAQFARVEQSYELRINDWRETEAQEIFFFPEAEGLTTPAAKQSAVIDDNVLTIVMEPGWLEQYDGEILNGVVTYKNSAGEAASYAIAASLKEAIVNPSNDPAVTVLPAASGNIALYLVFAFLGGVLLNFMPCVFPIIFVKAASFMESAQADRKTIQFHGLLFGAGVLSTFALMGGVLLLLRAGGEQLGWGFHLQSPIVVALSAYVLFLVGLNLFGFFTVGENFTGSGESLTRRGGATGAYFTGVLAVVVAAPCIGPLLTAPIGAALVLPAVAGMLIFLLMGLGLAAPYLLLSFIPSAGRLLPRPGPWIPVLKQALAFPVFAAAAYFLWVFSRQAGGGGLAMILAGAILLALAAWLFEKSKGEGTMAFAVRIGAALAAVLALVPLMRLEPATAAPPQSAAYGAIQSAPYSASLLAEYRMAGTPVFIDFTADWCVTCQFNKMTVLKSAEVTDAFAASGTILMVADWTVRDPEITKALEGYGASGVPLYVYYPPGEPAQILPQPLTRKAVISALAQGS
jgi:thiol:disulfide interchange protein/DsbC/DsbD-like thiol-disulfide interchange protein